jgi:4-hydroxybenzoate polyprenyltransferase
MEIRKAFTAWCREKALWDALVMACCGAGMAVAYAHEFMSVPLYLIGVFVWFAAYHFLNQMKRKSDKRIAELEASNARLYSRLDGAVYNDGIEEIQW